MKCKDCEFFSYGDSDDERIVAPWGNCKSEIFQDISERNITSDDVLFKYSDCENYMAYFHVHENFGCVGFKKK